MKTAVLWLLLSVPAFANQQDVKFIQQINPKVNENEARIISFHTRTYAAKYKLDPNLVLSIMGVESSFKRTAKSPRKSVGYMQVHHDSWKKDVGYKKIVPKKSDLLIPKVNIEAGCYVLSELRKEDNKRYVSKYLGERNYTYLQKVRRNRILHKGCG